MKIKNNIIEIVTTFFYVGYVPFAPGSVASLAGLFLFYLIKGNILLYIFFILLFLFLGLLLATKAEKLFNKKDARCIVIDEVLGMLLSLMFMPYDIKVVIIAFILFRIFDTLKPYPAGRLQNLPGSLGIMSDDIVAGLYTNVILQVALRLLSFRAS